MIHAAAPTVPSRSAPASTDLLDRILAAVPLLVGVLALGILYAWLAWEHKAPWLFTDELEMTQISRAIAETGHPARRGVAYQFTSLVPFFTAPAWLVHDTRTAYDLAKYIGVAAMVATAFPTYWLARTIVPPRYALFAALGAVAVPALAYSSQLLEEPFAYPAAALAFFLREPRREYLTVDAIAQRPPSIRLADAGRNLARTGPYLVFMASYTLQGAVSWVVIGWMPTVVSEQFHLGQGAAGFSTLAFFFIPQTIGLVAGGFWSDRWSAANPLSRILLPATAILLVGPVFLVTVWVHHMSLTLASLSLYGFAMGMLGANVMPIICLVVDARYRATAQGILNACAAVGGGVSIYVVGALRDAGTAVGLILSMTALGILLCGFLLWLVGVIRKKSGENAVDG